MSSPIIRCRPEAAHWVLVILLVLILAPSVAWDVVQPAADPGSRWFFGILASGLLLLDLALAIWLLRAQVVADRDGLRWRDLGRWRSAAWSEVLDYYDRPTRRDTTQMVVETRRGTLSWPLRVRSVAARALREEIARNAIYAPITAWGILGTRPDEPRSLVFEYRASDIRSMRAVLWGCALVWMAMMVPLIGLSSIRRLPQTLAQMGWMLGLLGGITLLGFVLSLPAMMFPAILALRETRRRRRQRVTADLHGLRFEDGSRQIEATWDEVTDYLIAPFPGVTAANRYMVVTRSGSFDFTSHLFDVAILARMIAHYVKNAPCQSWQPRADEVIGGDAQRWARGRDGEAERIYHYRTRTNRALLWFPTALAAIYALIPALMRQISVEPAPDTAAWRVTLGLGAVTLWAWWRYFHASVRVSRRGIAQLAAFGRRFIPWTEVRDYYQAGGDTMTFCVVAGARQRIRFWAGIADLDELKAEIARRAINSRSGGWTKR